MFATLVFGSQQMPGVNAAWVAPRMGSARLSHRPQTAAVIHILPLSKYQPQRLTVSGWKTWFHCLLLSSAQTSRWDRSSTPILTAETDCSEPLNTVTFKLVILSSSSLHLAPFCQQNLKHLKTLSEKTQFVCFGWQSLQFGWSAEPCQLKRECCLHRNTSAAVHEEVMSL